jgi:hypothetical protein
VHVVSNSAQGRLSSVFNLQLASNSGRAQVSVFGLRFEVLRTDETLYVKGNSAFYEELGGAVARAAAKLPAGAWLKAPVSASPLTKFATFTELNRELKVILDTANPLTTTGRTTTVSGQQAIELKETSKLFTAARFIATTGKPYPIEILKHGRETGQTTFSDWNKPVLLSAPAHAVAIK